MRFVMLAGLTLLVTFFVALLLRRRYRTIALIVGSIPVALLAFPNLEGLANGLVLVSILLIWGAGLAGSFGGAALARRVNARRR